MSRKKVLAFDFGASSGRAMLGYFDQNQIHMEEIHRFSNDPVNISGTLYWDIARLLFEVKQSIEKAVAKGGFDAIGIDTWGVDFGLIDKKGKLIGNPVHYRDLRTETTPQEVFKLISKEKIYCETGIQFMRINTLYQLFALKNQQPELLELTDKILLIPDLIAYFLTGKMRCEQTNASTTNIYNPVTKTWSQSLLSSIGMSSEILPEFIRAGQAYGDLSTEICEELACSPVPVIAVGTHDTASAVAAAPAIDKDFVYISCGTWSLFGTENETPVLTKQAQELNFTNEIGVGDKVRLLKNIMGLWLIQQSRQHWLKTGEAVTFNMLENEALESEPFRCFIDPDHVRFELPGNLPKRVQEFCRDTNQYIPQTRGEIMRCIYQSLALKYRYTFDQLKELTGKNYQSIHMLGGGIKDTLLCRMTANATGVLVKAGPIEATVMGNIAVQYIGLGELEDIKQVRKVIRNSVEIKTYEPTQADEWNEAYKKYIDILKGE
ncbi:MAG: rhamnulokinase family protein [Oscillospiraceae bacterium]